MCYVTAHNKGLFSAARHHRGLSLCRIWTSLLGGREKQRMRDHKQSLTKLFELMLDEGMAVQMSWLEVQTTCVRDAHLASSHS